MIKLDFKEYNLKEVDNLKGFAYFLICQNFKKFFDENFFFFLKK